MKLTFVSWRWLFLGCALLALALPVTARADDESYQGKGKGKDKAQKSNIIEIDLNNLPPDLAKALKKYAMSKETTPSPKVVPDVKPSKKPDPPAKTPLAGKSPFNATNLPPGLAKKPANHPGRVAWLKAHSGTPPLNTEPKKGKGKKGGD